MKLNCLLLFFCSFLFGFFPDFYLIGHSKEDPDPLRFEESFQKFSSEDRGIQSFGNDLTLFTGSSSIRKWTTLSTDFPEIQLLNRGFGGAHISDLIHYYPKLFPHYKPKRIILYCGENDLWSGKSYPQVLEDFQILWERIRSDLPNVTLIYLSCKPSPKRISKWNLYQALNLRIKNLCLRTKGMTFIDLSPTVLKANMKFHPGLWEEDQLHVNGSGYARWTKWIRPTLGL